MKSFFFAIVFFAASISFAQSKIGNTILGKVLVKDKAGKPVSDSSGVVVYLEGALSHEFHELNPRPKMASLNKDFTPEVLAVQTGTTVDFPNDDLVLHNVFSLSKVKPFDLGLYRKGTQKSVKFDKSGIVKVYCNIHEDMAGYIVVLDNPYFTVTDAEGDYKIPGVPNGKYAVKVWQRFGPGSQKEVILKGQDTKVGFEVTKGEEIDFDVVEQNKNPKHLNKFGKEYDKKY